MWNELVFTVKQSDADLACSILTVINNDGMYIEDFSDLMQNDAVVQTGLVEQDLLDKIGNDPIIHVYIAPSVNLAEQSQTAQMLLRQANIGFSVETREIPDKNWAEEWKKYYKPVNVSKTLSVVPCWQDYSPVPGELVVRLDPGAAFGTGTHETTKLCLGALERYVKPGIRMLDVGTGSGILAVTSLLLGAASADAVDIDPLSVKAAGENAALNAVSDRLHVSLGNLLECASGKYDVITANIVADVIISMLPDIGSFKAENGIIILSGITNSRAPEVGAAAKSNGFTVKECLCDGEWTAFIVG